jgi:hypothetical protein
MAMAAGFRKAALVEETPHVVHVEVCLEALYACLWEISNSSTIRTLDALPIPSHQQQTTLAVRMMTYQKRWSPVDIIEQLQTNATRHQILIFSHPFRILL